MINNSVFKLPFNTTFKGKEPNEKLQKSDIDITDENEEEYTFESTAKAIKNKDKADNAKIMRDALMALTVISLPAGYIIATDLNNDCNNSTGSSYVTPLNEEDIKILNKADSLAKTGRDDKVLEADEFLQLLDYSKMKDIPNLTQRNIKCISTGGYTPVNMNDTKAKEKILNQVKNTQYQINHLSNSYKNDPMKSSVENYAEYARNYVTDREILDKVDFSQLEYYQNDMTIVKAMINFSREKIRRDDADLAEKKQKAIKNAQELVNKIANQYETRAKISGNYNGDDILTKGEMASLLNIECLDGLPDELKFIIISKALEDYKPRTLGHVKKEDDAERENEKVEQDKQRAQERLNDWAYRAHKEFYHILHPNEIIMKKG